MISKGLRQLLISETVTAELQMLPEPPHKKISRRQSCPHLLSFIRDCLIIVKLRNFSHSVFTNFVDLLCFVLHYLFAFIFFSKHSSVLNIFFM